MNISVRCFAMQWKAQCDASYSKKSPGLTISMPLKRRSTSKSLSPVTMQSQLPAAAVAKTLSSSGSRHIGENNPVGLTTTILVSNSAAAASASSEVKLNLPVNVSRNSFRMNSEVINSWCRAQCSIRSLHTPRAMNAAMSTFVSRTILTRRDRTRPDRCRHPELAPWRSYAHAAS